MCSPPWMRIYYFPLRTTRVTSIGYMRLVSRAICEVTLLLCSPGYLTIWLSTVIGAGSNTFSAIRTGKGINRVSTNQDPHLLSVYDPTPIEIVQTKGETDYFPIVIVNIELQDGNIIRWRLICLHSWLQERGFTAISRRVSSQHKLHFLQHIWTERCTLVLRLQLRWIL